MKAIVLQTRKGPQRLRAMSYCGIPYAQAADGTILLEEQHAHALLDCLKRFAGYAAEMVDA